jgi:hypothetical protein
LGVPCPASAFDDSMHNYCGSTGGVCCEDPCALLPQFSSGNNEYNYIQALTKEIKRAIPYWDPHYIIDTSRNGITDERSSCASWCNVRGAGLGKTPSSNNLLPNLVDALFYLKTPGESDGCTETLPDGSTCHEYDKTCGDPDAIGSTNAIDRRDGAVTTNARYQNANSTLEVTSNAIDWLGVKLLGAYSWSKTDDRHVFNSVSGAQGFTPVPMGEHHGYAGIARFEVFDPLDADLDFQFEYFNIGRDWVSVFGARREQDLLLTEGFVDGQVATLNVANEFQDFSDPFYEPIIGWHGATATMLWSPGALELGGEGTFIEYNTDTGANPLDTDKVYPDFLYTDGMTDTELYSFANTNDRGRDPRSVYHQHQNRSTFIGVVKGSYTFDVWKIGRASCRERVLEAV